MNATDNASEFLSSIRQEMSGIMKQVDEFLTKVEEMLKEKENELDEKIKTFSTLGAREKKLKRDKIEFAVEKNAVEKQKIANRDKQLALSKKEEKIDKKLETIKNILD